MKRVIVLLFVILTGCNGDLVLTELENVETDLSGNASVLAGSENSLIGEGDIEKIIPPSITQCSLLPDEITEQILNIYSSDIPFEISTVVSGDLQTAYTFYVFEEDGKIQSELCAELLIYDSPLLELIKD